MALGEVSSGALFGPVPVETADLPGSVIVIQNESSSFVPPNSYHSSADVLAMDGAGQKQWADHIDDGPPELGGILLWTGAGPWLGIAGTNGLSPAHDYVAVPSDWFSAVSGPGRSFALSFGTANTPDAVNVIEHGMVTAQGSIAGSNSYDGLAPFPFLAGNAGDHLVLVSQVWHSQPALCYPSSPGTAALSRFDAASSWQCPLQFDGVSGVTGAVLLPGRVIVGRTTYVSTSCGYHGVQPVTIEAYSLPGESLAPSGWVQLAGSPGLGRRPIR